MPRCTDMQSKVSKEVLDIDGGHSWVVVEWEYSYTNSFASHNGDVGTLQFNIPYPANKRASMIMCKYCKKFERIYPS